MMTHDRLGDELRELGVNLSTVPDDDMLVQSVMRRIDQGEVAVVRRARARSLRRRLVAALVAALIVGLTITPAVRAAVADWFGVLVESGPARDSEPVPSVSASLTVEEAGVLVGFDPIVPDALGGSPDGVEVSDDRRVVSMSWSLDDRTIRLDQFEGMVSPHFVKRTPGAEFLTLENGAQAVWFGESHEVLPLGDDGEEIVELSRTAGPTLVWTVGDLTLRLEGLDRAEAVAVADQTF
jgi:hypothetical protein